MNKSQNLVGVAALVLAIALFSTIEIVSKQVGPKIHPFQIVFLRFFVAGVVILLLAAPGLLRMAPAWRGFDYGIFTLNGLVGVAIALTLFHVAVLVLEKAASCAVVFSANPLFVVVFARFINGEEWSWAKWLAVALGAAGVACFAWESGGLAADSLLGLGVILASAAFFALGICLSRRVMCRYGAAPLFGMSALFGSLFMLPLAVWSAASHGLAGLREAWLAALYIALPGTAIAYGLYYFGLGRTTAYNASLAFFLKPVLASIFAALWLGEHVNAPMITGTALIMGGLAVAVLQPRLVAARWREK